jgi:predicted nucleotidyltransferase
MERELEATLKKVREDFLPELHDIFGEAVKSVILYGSAARGSYVHGNSDVNLLIIIKESDPQKILDLGSEHARLIKKLRLSLHILSEGEFIRSADIFPMEYLDIREAGKVLYGEDISERLKLTKQNLRHQVEERLRGNINALRQALIASRGSSRLLSELLRESFGTLMAPLRGLIRLKTAAFEEAASQNAASSASGSSDDPAGEIDLLDQIGRVYEIDAAPLKEIYRFRERGRTDAKMLAVNAVTFLTELVRKVDELEVK